MAQGERDYARSRNALNDQRQVTADQMAFGEKTLEILSRLPPEQRRAAFESRAQEAQATVGLPADFDMQQAWSRTESQLPAFNASGTRAPSSRKRPMPDGTEVFEEWDGQAWKQIGDPAPRNPGQTINVNTGTPSQNALDDALVADQAKTFEEMQEAGRNARQLVSQISIARSIDVKTNPFESYKVIAKEIGSVLGIPVDLNAIGNAQSFQAVMGRLVNERVSQEKGPQTDADVRRFARTMASLDNPENAKDFLLGYSEAIAMRDIEKADFFRPRVRNRQDYEEINDEWEDYLQKTPIIRSDLADPSTGLPVFYYQFSRKMKEANPGISEEQILKVWREGADK
jgi:hypothetical protein